MKNNGIAVKGGRVDGEAVAAVALAITDIFTSAAENRVNDSTIERALGILESVGGVKSVTISNASVNPPVGR